jgi:predicted lipoprotein
MRKLGLVSVVALVLLTACSGIPGVYTVERSGDLSSAASGSGAPFTAQTYADEVWVSDVPAAADAAVPVADLFGKLATDPEAAQEAFGHNQGSGSPWSFMVAGEGTIERVDTTGASILLVLDQDYAPDAQVALQIGPAFIGTAIRDSLGTINFSEFVNQIDFADVATFLNDHVRNEVVAELDPATLEGATVTFVGAFSLVDPENIVITPVRLEVSP